MKTTIFLLTLCISYISFGQESYGDSLTVFRNNYIETHGVVKGADKEHLKFYTVSASFRVVAAIEIIDNSPWFKMETTGPIKPFYRAYAIARFKMRGDSMKLTIYQSQSLMGSEQYKNHLFLPFTDLSSGKDSYAGGRYIDLLVSDNKNGEIILDFNKAYNPYCAYVPGRYSCPVPPKENFLQHNVRAGEMNYAKPN
jgi:hypothetical protein